MIMDKYPASIAKKLQKFLDFNSQFEKHNKQEKHKE
jgi:hypothetical protein